MSSNINQVDGTTSALNPRPLSGTDAASTLAQLRALSAQANGGSTVGPNDVGVAASGVHSAIRSLNTTITALNNQISQSSTPALQQALSQAQNNLSQMKSGVAQLNNALNTAGVSSRIQISVNGAHVNNISTSGLGSTNTAGNINASPLDAPANENPNLLASGNVLDANTLAASPGLQMLKSAIQNVLSQVLSGQLNPDGTPTGSSAGASGSTSASQMAGTGSGTPAGISGSSSTPSPTPSATPSTQNSGSSTPTTHSATPSASGGSTTPTGSSLSGTTGGISSKAAVLLGGSQQDFANSLFQALFDSIKKIKAHAVDATNSAPGTNKQGGTNQLQTAGGAGSGAGANAAPTSTGNPGGNTNTAGSGDLSATPSTQNSGTTPSTSNPTTPQQASGGGATTQQAGGGGTTPQSGGGGATTQQTGVGGTKTQPTSGGGATTQQTGGGVTTPQTGGGAKTQQAGGGGTTPQTGGGATTQQTGGGAKTQGTLPGGAPTVPNQATMSQDPLNISPETDFGDSASYAPDPLLSYPNINGLLQALLLESYSGSQKDLKSAAAALQQINNKKNGLRSQYDAAIAGGQSSTDPGPTKIKDALDQSGDDTQLLQISIQTATQNSSQALTTLTNFIKATNDNAQAVIRHIGGG